MIEPVKKTIRVPATPSEAFDRFTTEIGRWWPKETHSVAQAECRSVHWDGPGGAELYEVTADGERNVWGTFTEWEPPRAFAMSWHPGGSPETAQRVRVTFAQDGEETLVTLTHSGFEALGERGAAARDDYDGGWKAVLQKMADHLERGAAG